LIIKIIAAYALEIIPKTLA